VRALEKRLIEEGEAAGLGLGRGPQVPNPLAEGAFHDIRVDFSEVIRVDHHIRG
jgi:hypothetical protein